MRWLLMLWPFRRKTILERVVDSLNAFTASPRPIHEEPGHVI